MKKTFKQFGIIFFVTIIGFTMAACPQPDNVDTSPTVTDVTVDPATPNVVKGGTQIFTATVTGINNPAQTVTWSIDQTNKNSGTTIDANGVLTVAATETLTSLIIRATSTVDTAKSGTATVTINNNGANLPTVTNVTVDPLNATVVKGGNQTFTATVIGTNDPAQTVTWSIEQTNKDTGTTINENGVLTVAATETLALLTVRATSTVDNTKSGTATVTVIMISLEEALNILESDIGYTGEFPTPDGTNYGGCFYNGTDYLVIWWTDADEDKFADYKAKWATLGKTSAIRLARSINIDEGATLNLGKGVGNKDLYTSIYFTVGGGTSDDGINHQKTYHVPENSICFMVFYY